MMVQPKKPPLSFRLPDALIAEIDAWAADNDMSRNAAVRALVELGLSQPGRRKPMTKADRDEVDAGIGQLAKVKGKPQAEPVQTPPRTSSVPFAGNLVRGPIQKGGKR